MLEFVKVIKLYGFEYNYNAANGWEIVIENITEEECRMLENVERTVIEGRI